MKDKARAVRDTVNSGDSPETDDPFTRIAILAVKIRTLAAPPISQESLIRLLTSSPDLTIQVSRLGRPDDGVAPQALRVVAAWMAEQTAFAAFQYQLNR